MTRGNVTARSVQAGVLAFACVNHAWAAPVAQREFDSAGQIRESELNDGVGTADAASSGTKPGGFKVEASSSECGQVVRLDRAPADPETMDVSFNPEWIPLLHEVTNCLGKPEFVTACLQVQGQFDTLTFADAVVRAIGSQRAAQLYRARGRAERIVSEFYALGVAPERIIMIPPPAEPTYRGVELTIKPDCGILQPPRPATSATEESSPQVAQQGLAPSPPTRTTFVDLPREKRLGPAWFGGTLAAGALFVNPEDVYFLSLRAALGWSSLWYVRGFMGASVANTREERAGFEWGLAGGYRVNDWLELGGVAAHRITSSRPLKAWLEQTLSTGAEVSERFFRERDASVWISESVWPLSWRTQRASYVNGVLFDSADRTDYAPRVEVSLTVRAHVL